MRVTLLPDCLDDYIGEDNPVRVVDAFVDELDLGELGFDGVAAALTGRPGYHPAVLLKLYIYGYLNRIQSSRRLERECQRNVELMWLTSRLAPDFKTIADFRKDNGKGIRNVCRRFVAMCRQQGPRAVQQTRFYLRRKRQRIPVSCRAAHSLPPLLDGERHEDKQLLVLPLQALLTKVEVHDRRSTPRQTLGT
jgi:transposase